MVVTSFFEIINCASVLERKENKRVRNSMELSVTDKLHNQKKLKVLFVQKIVKQKAYRNEEIRRLRQTEFSREYVIYVPRYQTIQNTISQHHHQRVQQTPILIYCSCSVKILPLKSYSWATKINL